MSELTPYTCAEAFRRLDDYLDRELTAEEMRLVREHLEICAGCAREFSYEASVLDNVRGKLRQLDVPEELRAKVAELLKHDHSR